MNRGEMGSGHGWAMGWGVAWNNLAKSYLIQMPPGSANWSIGNRGEQMQRTMPTYNPGPPLPDAAPRHHRIARCSLWHQTVFTSNNSLSVSADRH